MSETRENERPIVAITMGDPAGVGPEVVVKALAGPQVYEWSRPLVVGDLSTLERASKLVPGPLRWRAVAGPEEARFRYGTADVLDLHNVDCDVVRPGEISAEAGRAAVEAVLKALERARAGRVGAMATGPLNKEAIRLAGYPFIGHTEILAEMTHTACSTTMLATGPLRVVHVTRHVPFREIAGLITRESVLETIRLTESGMRAWGLPQPRLGVAALNPHGGEGGILGDEELRAIIPAVRDARAEGINALGPFPADSIFVRALHGEFDAVVAMYHDQGHIPIKVHGFEESVTVTLGLPIVRTSVDHGTAFDIAWKGVASERSMREAIRLAAQLCPR